MSFNNRLFIGVIEMDKKEKLLRLSDLEEDLVRVIERKRRIESELSLISVELDDILEQVKVLLEG